jgi:hypothetical protein
MDNMVVVSFAHEVSQHSGGVVELARELPNASVGLMSLIGLYWQCLG